MNLQELQSEYEVSSSQSLGWVLLNEKQIRYDEFVRKLFKHEDHRNMVDHARGGVCEEAGELSTCLKRHVVYGKPFNRENCIEELGDLRFFMQAVMNLFGIDEQEVLQHNALKLAKRYEGLVYSDQAAQNRTDKIGTGETK